MTPSISKVFKLIFHNLTPRYPPPAPLNLLLLQLAFSPHVVNEKLQIAIMCVGIMCSKIGNQHFWFKIINQPSATYQHFIY